MIRNRFMFMDQKHVLYLITLRNKKKNMILQATYIRHNKFRATLLYPAILVHIQYSI